MNQRLLLNPTKELKHLKKLNRLSLRLLNLKSQTSPNQLMRQMKLLALNCLSRQLLNQRVQMNLASPRPLMQLTEPSHLSLQLRRQPPPLVSTPSHAGRLAHCAQDNLYLAREAYSKYGNGHCLRVITTVYLKIGDCVTA